jgi:hypothetical protein
MKKNSSTVELSHRLVTLLKYATAEGGGPGAGEHRGIRQKWVSAAIEKKTVFLTLMALSMNFHCGLG